MRPRSEFFDRCVAFVDQGDPGGEVGLQVVEVFLDRFDRQVRAGPSRRPGVDVVGVGELDDDDAGVDHGSELLRLTAARPEARRQGDGVGPGFLARQRFLSSNAISPLLVNLRSLMMRSEVVPSATRSGLIAADAAPDAVEPRCRPGILPEYQIVAEGAEALRPCPSGTSPCPVEE